jgi:hypothetical protein
VRKVSADDERRRARLGIAIANCRVCDNGDGDGKTKTLLKRRGNVTFLT